MEKKMKKAYCPVDYAFQRIGGKYKGRIIWCLREGCLRYGELIREVEGISPKMLTQTLKDLEEDRLVIRIAYPVIPPHVEYKLSETGMSLLPFIDQMRIWGGQQMAEELSA